MTPGQPWKIVFLDGRVAEVVYDGRSPLVLQIPFQVTENTCTEKTGMRGKFQTSFAFGRMILQWKNHPEPKKVGTRLVFKNKVGEQEVAALLFVSAADAERFPLMAKKLVPQELAGSDFSWLPGGGAKAPEQAYLIRWDIEGMILNEETGLTENRTIGLIQGVTLKAQQDGKLRLTNAKRYLSGTFSIFQGDIWSLVSRGTNGDACLISMKSDLASALAALTAFFNTPVNLEPYPFDVDEFSTTAMPETLKQFIAKPQDYNVQ